MPAIIVPSSYTPGFSSAEQSGLAIGRGMARNRLGSCGLAAISDVENVIPQLDRDKLAKILGLLGSAESGEILSAARAADALIRTANTSWAEVLNQNVGAGKARALLAENAKLRLRAHQLLLENDALRKKAARAHGILDGAKQWGQALVALAIAFDGIEFLSHQLAARRRDGGYPSEAFAVGGWIAGMATPRPPPACAAGRDCRQ